MGMMKKILIAVLFVLSFSDAFSQAGMQRPVTRGYRLRNVIIDSFFALPADTFTVPADMRTFPFIVRKGTGLYIWNTSTFVWEAVSGGSTPTWQQTLTAGSTLTGDNTIIGGDFNFTFNESNFIVMGTEGAGTPIPAYTEAQMFFSPLKAAIRAGKATGTTWNNSNIGSYSAAFGSNNTASDDYSMSWGRDNEAVGVGTTAWGNDNTSSGNYGTSWGSANVASGTLSTAWGETTTATQEGATAWGHINNATGTFSTAFGYGNDVTGANATGWGFYNEANGKNSTVWGDTCWANGEAATAWGKKTWANGAFSTGFGYGIKAQGYSTASVGTWNDSTSAASATSFNAANRAFEIGIGTSNTARANAMTVLYSGNVGIGTLTPTSLLHVNGVTQMGTAGSTLGQLLMSGNTSGTVTIKTAAAAGTYSLTLPTTDGDASQFLQTDGSGVLIFATAATASNTMTFTNKRWSARVGSTASSGTPTINTDDVDIYKLTAQAADITSFTTNLSGTPVDGDILEIQITGTAARGITWGASFVSTTVTLPTTTTSTATLTVILQYYTTSSYGNNKWHCVNYY